MITRINVKFSQWKQPVGWLSLDGCFTDEQIADITALCDKLRAYYNNMGEPFAFEIGFTDEEV